MGCANRSHHSDQWLAAPNPRPPAARNGRPRDRRARQPPGRRLRGGRALPGPDRVPRAPDRRRDAPTPPASATSSRRSRPTSLWRSRSCAPPTAATGRRRHRRRPRGGRGPEALRRAGDRRHRAQLRLLRVQRRLGAEAGALPRPRPRHPARRRPDRPHGRLAERDELAVAALLHDVGRLVISRLHPGYKVYFDARAHPRAAPARRTRAARHRPRAGRRRPRPALEPAAADRGRDRAPPRRGRRRPARRWSRRRHDRPPRAGRGGLAGTPARQRRALGLDADSAPRPPLRVSAAAPGRRRGSASPARSRLASSTSSAASPRARSTSRSPRR